MLRWALLLMLLLLGTSCGMSLPLFPRDLPQAQPVAALPGADWRAIAPGMEWRRMFPGGDELAQLIVLRIDPEVYEFRTVYRPGAPLRVAGWREQLPQAELLVNTNFFNRARQAIGYVVSDGRQMNAPDTRRGGLFLVVDGLPAVIGIAELSEWAGASIEQAAQGWPLLVRDGKAAYDDRRRTERNRRTVIAQDQGGRILIMVAPLLGLSLADLSAYLERADLQIVTALNMDGGGSTLLALPQQSYVQPAWDAVPAILALYRR